MYQGGTKNDLVLQSSSHLCPGVPTSLSAKRLRTTSDKQLPITV